MCNLVRTGIFIVELFRFITKPYCSDICGYHRCPQILAEIWRNLGICCGYMAVAAREK